MTEEAKRLSLYETHVKAGAKMVPFAGYMMPVSYEGIKEEHTAVRNQAGLFDVSHMGEFIISGPGAKELVQYVTTNNVNRLAKGQAQYSCLPNEKGGIVDDLLVYCLDDTADAEEYLLVVNAGNIQKDWDWISSHNSYGAKMENRSEQTGLLALQGPAATAILQPLTETAVGDIKYYHFAIGQIGHIPDVVISATGYTGSGGFELYVENRYLDDLWHMLLTAGAPYGLTPSGLGSRDTLRLEKSYCLYGNDLDDETSPIEASLGWIVKTKKGDFIARDIFARQRAEGVSKKLIGFKMLDRRVPRHGYIIKNTGGKIIGHVTSGTQSPTLEVPIGMGYIQTADMPESGEILVSTGRKDLQAQLCHLPFLK